nr:alpha/beta fold hydrolase [Angustibacter aerolatus]
MTSVDLPDGARAWCDDRGTGTPLLLLAGQSLAGSMWGDLAGDLAAHHRVLVLDARGTGRSDGFSATTWTTADFARDVVAVLDGLGVERADVLGFSMGGRVAQVLAAEHAERVDRLVLAGSGLGGPHDVPRPHHAIAALMRAASPGGRAAMTDLMVSPGWAAAHPEWTEQAAPARRPPRHPPALRRQHRPRRLGPLPPHRGAHPRAARRPRPGSCPPPAPRCSPTACPVPGSSCCPASGTAASPRAAPRWLGTCCSTSPPDPPRRGVADEHVTWAGCRSAGRGGGSCGGGTVRGVCKPLERCASRLHVARAAGQRGQRGRGSAGEQDGGAEQAVGVPPAAGRLGQARGRRRPGRARAGAR